MFGKKFKNLDGHFQTPLMAFKWLFSRKPTPWPKNVLRKEFPKASIYYHLGNHDIRYQMWLQRHPEIFGDPYYELENRREKIYISKAIPKPFNIQFHPCECSLD